MRTYILSHACLMALEQFIFVCALQMSILKLACENYLTETRRPHPNTDDNFHDDSATGHGSLACNTMVINVTKSGATNCVMAWRVNAKRRLVGENTTEQLYANRYWEPWPGRGDIIIFELQSESMQLKLMIPCCSGDNTGPTTPDYSVWPCDTWQYRASSELVKSMFFTAGHLLNSKRSSLAPHELNLLFNCAFIHDKRHVWT